MRVLIIVGLSGLLVALSACQSSQVLPTVVNVQGVQTAAAQTQVARPTATATPTKLNQLPPTFTPTPSETAQATVTPVPLRSAGRIYYLYNDDSIATVNANGTDNAIVVTLGVGKSISEYAVSPDHTRLAFVAPGAGSGREVYTSDISGANVQKLSCLGFSDVRSLVWTPDGQQILFFAAPAAGASGDIYIMQSTNGQGCPNGNSQRVLAPLQAVDFRAMTLNRSGSLLFYAGGGTSIYIWDMQTNARYLASGEPAYGPDSFPRQNPATDTLAFLRQSGSGSQTAGNLILLTDSTRAPAAPSQSAGEPYEALDLRWSQDGSLLLMMKAAGILVFDTSENSLIPLPLTGLRLPEAAAANRSAIAYTAYDAKNVIQIYIYDLAQEKPRQVTTNPDGTIRSITWVEGA